MAFFSVKKKKCPKSLNKKAFLCELLFLKSAAWLVSHLLLSPFVFVEFRIRAKSVTDAVISMF